MRSGRERVAAWRRDHPDRRLMLSGARLTGTDLSGCVLRGAELRRVDLSGARLAGADLSRCDLTGAVLEEADLTGADLREASLGDARLASAVLDRADMRGASAHSAGPDLEGASLRRARLDGADLSGARLVGADLGDADLGGADLSEAHLGRADLRGASVGWTTFYASTPDSWRRGKPSVRFHDADLRTVKAEGADLVAASFVGADLSQACLAGANLAGADLSHATVAGADFTGADLSEADLTATSAEDSHFGEAVLLGTRCHRTRLHGADFGGAWFGDTLLTDTGLVATTGLDSARHVGPSTLDSRTQRRSPQVSAAFLAGCAGPGAPAESVWLVVGAESDASMGERAVAMLTEQGHAAWWIPGDRFLADRPRLRATQLCDLARTIVALTPPDRDSPWLLRLTAVAGERGGSQLLVVPIDDSLSGLVGQVAI